ncbi:U32 family peptidase [Paenibacillus sp. AK121]|uniref:peptidase U32 family protein n=1 Tax=Paenibacillus TaxID=44249 RepID=UPI001C250BBB|nr:peptidase U32 family protein [Paenibacillus sp. AK121]MBU9705359.1 U32 family peptidase [Paenibacillus sp. AK121]MEE4568569.1 peptidase U32 family protein [Paenibacillus polymyxa]
MAYKPELLATASSPEDARHMLEAGATALLIGDDRFGMRLPGHFTPDQIREVVEEARKHAAQVYVSMTNLMTNELLPLLPKYVQTIAECGIDAIEFNDPAVLMAVKEHAPHLKLFWNGEMISTNFATANYWGEKGASRVILARELSMDEITEMIPKLNIEAQVQVHGMTNIYHSKRKLVQSYMLHQGRTVEGDLGRGRGLFLIEAERQEEKFPIYEDINGTHIMSSDDFCIMEDLHILMEAGVHSFKIEGLLKPTAYNEAVVRAYRKAIDSYTADPDAYVYDESWLDEVRRLQDPERELSFGFFYKEQVY